MRFLNKIFAEAVNLTPHATGEWYLKIKTNGEIVKAVAVQETDPTVGGHIKNITAGQISNWDQAFSWGNHANAGYQTVLSNPITGTGTTNYLSKFTPAGTISDSTIFDNGTNVGIGTSNPSYEMHLKKAGTARYFVETTSTNSLAYHGATAGNSGIQLASFGTGYASPWTGKSGIYVSSQMTDTTFNIWRGNQVLLNTTAGGFLSIGATIATEKLDVDGKARIRNILNATGDFLNASATGVIQKRTAAEVRGDIGAAASSHTHTTAQVTGLDTALAGKAPTSHTHTIAQVTNLQNDLNSKASTSHTHAWNDILSKPDFNNTVNVLEINASSLSGTGTMEAQVADFLNSSQTVIRDYNSSSLFVKLVGYEPDPGTGGTGGTGPGVTAITANLELYYDFGALNWFTGSVSTITNFSSTNTTTGSSFGGVDHKTDFGGYLHFNGSLSRHITTNQNYTNLGLTGPNTLVFVFRVPSQVWIGGDNLVFCSNNYTGINQSLHTGYRNSKILRGHYGNDVLNGNVGLGTWYHVALTQDASGSKFYINGVLVTTQVHSYITGNSEVFIARWVNNYFTIDLGLAMIYSKTLTSAEVTTLYTEQKTRFGI